MNDKRFLIRDKTDDNDFYWLTFFPFPSSNRDEELLTFFLGQDSLNFFVNELAKFYRFFIPIDLDYFVICACDLFARFCCDCGLFLFAFDLLIPYYCFLPLLFIDNFALVSDLLLKIVRSEADSSLAQYPAEMFLGSR
jgi:hypothetical protein